MKANKDGGTTVGFTMKDFADMMEQNNKNKSHEEEILFVPKEFFEIEKSNLMNKECEHEWNNILDGFTGNVYGICRKCGVEKPKTKWNDDVKDIGERLKVNKECEHEPYMGWCDIEGCENEAANNGGCWRESGYWLICSKHSQEHREGKPQPQMKQSAIDRENSRDANGYLPSPPPIDFHIEENLEQINNQQWEDILDEYSKSKEFDMGDLRISHLINWLKKNYNAPEKNKV